MLLFLCAQLQAAEPSNELIISSVSQENAAQQELGVDEQSFFEVAGVYGINEKLSISMSYGYSTITTQYDTPYREGASSEYYYDDYYEGSSFGSEFAQHMISIGPRYRHSFNDWASVYGKLEGNISYSSLRFAPVLTEDDPISQVASSSLFVGANLAGGAMGTIRLKEDVPEFLIVFEVGYSLQSLAQYEKIGDLDLSGMYSSLGCGLRF